MVERTLGFREYAGDYQRQLFLVDHAGLPLKTALEQVELLGGEVVPVLRKEVGGPPGARGADATDASRVKAKYGDGEPASRRRMPIVATT